MSIFKVSSVLMILISEVIYAQTGIKHLKLQQVLIFSRHNIRAPLTTGETLKSVSSKQWPGWSVKGGELTPKGKIMERELGEYTRNWLDKNNLTNKKGCPKENEILLYANSLERTISTAQNLAEGAFPDYGLTVLHKGEIGTMNPLFKPAFRDVTKKERKRWVKQMEKKLQSYDLNKTYQLLDDLTNIASSRGCKNGGFCSLTSSDQENSFIINDGDEPAVEGPLKVATSIADAFAMQYYEGFGADSLAWGGLQDPKDLEQIFRLLTIYQNVLFTTKGVAQNLAQPLLYYINSTFSKGNPKVTILVGHDSNIATLLKSLTIETDPLPEQFESTPIGGQIIFERWLNQETGREFVKVEYVYQTTLQIREGKPLSKANSPQRIPLKFSGEKPLENNFYPWTTFNKKLHQALRK